MECWVEQLNISAEKHAHFVALDYSHAPYIFHDYRDDHRHKMSRPSDCPRDGWTKCQQVRDGHTNCESLTSDYHSRTRDADVILFQSGFFTNAVTFCRTDHIKKNHDNVTDQALVAKMSLSMYWSHQIFEHHRWLSQLSTWRWHGCCFGCIYLWHWQWHFEHWNRYAVIAVICACKVGFCLTPSKGRNCLWLWIWFFIYFCFYVCNLGVKFFPSLFPFFSLHVIQNYLKQGSNHIN